MQTIIQKLSNVPITNNSVSFTKFQNIFLQKTRKNIFDLLSVKWALHDELHLNKLAAFEIRKLFPDSRTVPTIKSFRVYCPRGATTLIRISINHQRNGARIDHLVSVFWKRPGGRNRLLAQTLAHKNFKLVLVCQPGRVISIDCEDNVPFWKLPSEPFFLLGKIPLSTEFETDRNSIANIEKYLFDLSYSIAIIFFFHFELLYELFLIIPMYFDSF